MKRVPSKQRNFVIHRERDRAALKRLALMLLSGLVLAGGFVYAAGQHFSALRFGYEGEKLRSERTRLLEEQHRLLLEREVAATPARRLAKTNCADGNSQGHHVELATLRYKAWTSF